MTNTGLEQIEDHSQNIMSKDRDHDSDYDRAQSTPDFVVACEKSVFYREEANEFMKQMRRI